jgi:hypothetical protein
MTLYLKDPKDSTKKKNLGTDKYFWQKSKIQNQLTKTSSFSITSITAEKDIRKQSHL